MKTTKAHDGGFTLTEAYELLQQLLDAAQACDENGGGAAIAESPEAFEPDHLLA